MCDVRLVEWEPLMNETIMSALSSLFAWENNFKVSEKF